MAGVRIPAESAALTVAQVAREVIREQARELQAQARDVRRGRDPEAVHQMRVATRRLRAGLRVCRGRLEVPKPVARDLRWLARRLGEVRDRDVILVLLGARRGTAAKPRGVAVRQTEPARELALRRVLERQRAEAQRELRAALKKKRYRRLLRELDDFGRRPVVHGDEDALAPRVLAESISGLAEAVARHPGMQRRHPSSSALHDLRIEFKRLRYALDFHAAACGLAYDVERRLARAMQDVLGELHDHDLLLGWLRKGRGAFRGEWPRLTARLADERARLLRRFLAMRVRWQSRTRAEPTVAMLETPRFVNLEAAPVTLRLVAGAKQVA